jgi:hypothetical protein
VDVADRLGLLVELVMSPPTMSRSVHLDALQSILV